MIKQKDNHRDEIIHGSLFLLSPKGNVVLANRGLKITRTTNFVKGFPKVLFYNGLWSVIFEDSNNNFEFIQFLMMGQTQEYEGKKVQLNHHEEGIIKMVLMSRLDVEPWLKQTFIKKDTCIVGESCNHSFWSSRFPDSISESIIGN